MALPIVGVLSRHAIKRMDVIVLCVALLCLCPGYAKAGTEDVVWWLFKAGRAAAKGASTFSDDPNDKAKQDQRQRAGTEDAERAAAEQHDKESRLLMILGGLCLAGAGYLFFTGPGFRRWAARDRA